MNYAEIHAQDAIKERSEEVDQSEEVQNNKSNETSIEYAKAIKNFKKGQKLIKNWIKTWVSSHRHMIPF